MDEKRIDQLLRAACDFGGLGMQARQAARKEYRAAEKNEENTLRILIDGAMATLAMKTTNKIEATDEKISYQLGVSASFVRTHFIISDMMMDGDLVEAMVLLRKQLESLVRLHEIDNKPLGRLDGKVPNIQNTMNKSAGRIYGNLSEVAHFAKPKVTELLHVIEQGDRQGPSLLPHYSASAMACFDLDCYITIHFLVWFVGALTRWYPDYVSEEDKQLVGYIAKLALDTGVVRVSEDSDDTPSPATPAT